MKWGEFKEAISILDKYVDDEEPCAVCAEHDQFWAGPGDASVVSEDDRARLDELGWFVDNGDSWSCYT